MAIKMFISAKKLYRVIVAAAVCTLLYTVFVFAKKEYSNPDFGKTFGAKATEANNKLVLLNENFALCGKLCNADARFMQSLVFPEVMRYSSIKDGIETESLRTLYVQLGEDYANFSIGLFQMKPSFAVQVETKAKQLLSDSIYKELQLPYSSGDEETIRLQRVERLQDTDWQMIYLTAFVSICNVTYKAKTFAGEKEKLQWYATVYNAGFDKTDDYISKKTEQENFYLQNDMPGKKFRYAAIAGWYFAKMH
jgi:hypothetical protein